MAQHNRAFISDLGVAFVFLAFQRNWEASHRHYRDRIAHLRSPADNQVCLPGCYRQGIFDRRLLFWRRSYIYNIDSLILWSRMRGNIQN